MSDVSNFSETCKRVADAAGHTGPGLPAAPIGTSYLVSTFGGRLSVELRALPGTLDGAVRARLLDRIEDGVHALLEIGTAA